MIQMEVFLLSDPILIQKKKFNLNEFIMKPVFVARPRKSYFCIEEVNLHLGICCSSRGLIDVDKMKTFEDTKCSFE